MTFTRKNLGYNWTDYKTRTDILDALQITSVIEKINVHKSNGTNHMNRMLRNTFQQVLRYFHQKVEEIQEVHEETGDSRNEVLE